jgi:tRNA nucleotidyltransferase/poly(A) polymerase
MLRTEFLDIHLFLHDMSLLKLFRAAAAAGGAVRVVGGAVRDALVGQRGSDINLATNLSPEELVEACNEAGLMTVPYGLKAATTGVVLHGKTYEVSSLWQHSSKAAELITEGYTDDWQVDASRRDLTVNAIYADEHGNVFDYYNGISDLEAGRIRFIGQAAEKIRENPIRIMRFFRFYSCFGKGEPDTESLKACIELKELLRNVSIEQIRDELFKLVMTPRVCLVLDLLLKNDILGYILPSSDRLDAVARLIDAVAACEKHPDALRRLYVLYCPNAVLAESLGARLHLSKAERKRLMQWAKIDIPSSLWGDPDASQRLIYEYGKDFCTDKLLFATSAGELSVAQCQETARQIEQAIVPVFPIGATDLMRIGAKDSAQIGACLTALRAFWVQRQFQPTFEELSARALDLLHGRNPE